MMFHVRVLDAKMRENKIAAAESFGLLRVHIREYSHIVVTS